MRLVSDNSIDFERYSKIPADAARVKPASQWCEEVQARINGDARLSGQTLPWGKTHENLRLRAGELSVWAGVGGHGKSNLLIQIMLWLLPTEKACIASLEMPPAITMERMTKQAAGNGYPPDSFIQQFHTWTDNRLWLYDQQGSVKAGRMIAVVRYATEELGITHFVIDSMMKCGIKLDDYTAQRDFVDELHAHAKDSGAHIHLIAHSRKRDNEHRKMDKFDVKGAGEITDQADNVFIVWRNKAKEERVRRNTSTEEDEHAPDCVVRCEKNRNGEWEGAVSLWFHPSSRQFVPGNRGNSMQFNFGQTAGYDYVEPAEQNVGERI